VSWERSYRGISRRYIRDIFTKYKYFKARSDDLAAEATAIRSSYNIGRERTSHGDGQAWQRYIDKKAEYDSFISEIDSVMQKLPGMFKKILIDYFLRGKQDVEIYMGLELPERTYYRIKSDTVKTFVDEYISGQVRF